MNEFPSVVLCGWVFFTEKNGEVEVLFYFEICDGDKGEKGDGEKVKVTC